MNLIEKVAKALKPYIFDLFDTDECIDAAKASISAMPSIKWQKIETLLDTKHDARILIWCGSLYVVKYSITREYFKYRDNDHYVDDKLVTHWAEINAPEEE